MKRSPAETFPNEIADAIVLEHDHFAAAPAAFLSAWKRGVLLAGFQYFGTASRVQVEHADHVSTMTPDVHRINRAIGAMSSGKRIFLAALVSFYDAESGGRLLRHAGVHGLSDLGRLDLQRREIVAALIVNYTGW